jgi:hypothetical protein
MKAKAKRKLQQWKLHDITPKRIGRHAAMHGTCPCWMCTEPFAPEHPKDVFQPEFYK